MAEPESILQLGIEAAREGKKEEARQLFRLLTRQQPGNAQGWLWLAGVAENREERQNALERVLELEPDNEMAIKGLQALGVRPGAPKVGTYDRPPEVAPVVVPPPVAPPPAPSARVDDPFGDDGDPFAELDALSETMASDTSGPVRRSEPPVEAVAAASAVGSTSASRSEPSSRRSEPSSRRSEPSSRRVTTITRDDEYEASNRRFSPLLGLLLFLVGLGLIGLLIAFLPGLFGGDNQRADVTTQPVSTATALAMGGGVLPTVDPNAPIPTINPNAPPIPTVDPNAPVPTIDPNAPPMPTIDPNAPVPTIDPNAPPAPTVDAGAGGQAPGGQAPGGQAPGGQAPGGQAPGTSQDVSQANPAIVNANTPLQSQGWLYDFNQPTFAASIIGNLGQFTPTNGRFVVVLAFVVNNTGTPQTIPGNFFVLRDAQGRVWESRPDISAAYVVPGVNADLAQTQTIPADGITRSVAVIFDVAPDATDLVFFARSNPSQGWLVLRSV